MIALAALTIGISLNGTHGVHRESDGTATAPLIPAPLVTASERFSRFELKAQGLPPIGPLRVANNGLGMQNVALTYADATLRYWNRRRTFALGIGETLYNQRTSVLLFRDPGGLVGTEYDMSRVVGVRYEAVERIPVRAESFVELQLAADPRMHGRFTFERQTAFRGRTYGYTSKPYWEGASQIDASVRFVHRFGAYSLSYGVRYLNYTASFRQRGWSAFADANALVMPFVGIERRLGR